MSSPRLAGCAALLCLWASVGCRFAPAPEPSPWTQDLALSALAPELAREPLPFRLAVAPLRLGFDPELAQTQDAQRRALPPDLRELRRELVSGLQELGLFERVAERGREGEALGAVARQAWDARDDLILELELLDYHQAYLSHVNQGAWLTLYVGAIFPAYWVPVDRYGCQIELRARLFGPQGKAPLFEEVYRVRANEVAQELRPLDREFVGLLDLYALWNVWTSLDDSNWRAIERQVAPHAWRRVLLRAFEGLEARVARPLRDEERREETLRQVRKRFALVAGVTRYQDPRLGSAPYAAEDAQRIAELFASPAGGALSATRGLTLLRDSLATREGILRGLSDLAARAAPSDEVVIYLAGKGASGIATVASDSLLAPSAATSGDSSAAPLESATQAPLEGGAPPERSPARQEGPRLGPRAVFLCADTQSERPWSTGLTLEDLSRALAKFRAERVLVVIDAGFGAPEEGGRTWELPREPGRFEAAETLRALTLRPGHAVLFAAQPDQTALALPGPEAGLLSYALDLGLRGAADRNGDGRVDLGEAVAYVRREVQARAGLEGFSQTPLLQGALPQLGWPR